MSKTGTERSAGKWNDKEDNTNGKEDNDQEWGHSMRCDAMGASGQLCYLCSEDNPYIFLTYDDGILFGDSDSTNVEAFEVFYQSG